MKIHKRHLDRVEHATSVDARTLTRLVVAEVARQAGLDLDDSRVTYHCRFRVGPREEPIAEVILWEDRPKIGG